MKKVWYHHITMKRFAAFTLILMVVFGALWLDSNYRLVTESFAITSWNLPFEADGLRIVHLTDLHGEWSDSLLRQVREAKPDLIAITGDIVDGTKDNFDTERGYILMAVGELSRIAPVYYVPGNHEWASSDPRGLFRAVGEAGGTVLRNDYVVFRGIVIAGCDDPNGQADQPSIEETVGRIREREGGRFILMLYHRNDRLTAWSDLGVDCVLCGHAHGGAVRLPFTDGLYGPGHNWFPEHTSGVYSERDTDMVVSRGIGGAKYRLFNNPEIISLTLSIE